MPVGNIREYTLSQYGYLKVHGLFMATNHSQGCCLTVCRNYPSETHEFYGHTAGPSVFTFLRNGKEIRVKC